MDSVQKRIRDWIVSYVSGLRFPYLFLLTAVLFLTDLFFPDTIPFMDEILLGLGTLLLGRLKRSGSGDPARR